jgi:hypothetical protein
MFRRKRQAVRVDVGIYAQGWIEPLRGEPIEGLFVADGYSPPGLELLGLEGAAWLCAWHQITDVRMVPRGELSQKILDAHRDAFAKSTAPNVFLGWLPDQRTGRVGITPFVLVPVGDHTWSDWHQVFVNAGLLEGGG